MTSSTAASHVSILLIEDENDDAVLLRMAASGLAEVRIQHVTTLEAGLERLSHESFDLVISDLGLPGCAGVDACVRLCAHAPDTPVVVLTGNDWEVVGARAIQAGAQDFMSKEDLSRQQLVRTIRHARERHRLLQSVRSAERAAETSRQAIAQAYARLERVEALRADLTSMIVHDLRTPLSGIRSYLELALRRGEPTSEIRSYLKPGYAACTALGDLIDTLLDVQRLESGDLRLLIERAEVGSLVDDAVEAVRGCHPEAIVRAEGPAVTLRCDRDLMRRVIVNLLDNAAKHTGRGGVQLDWRLERDEFELSVRDDGPGVRPEHHASIFQKFGCVELSTRGRRSTGLGLPFCRLVVEAHGGRIGLDSTVGQGSRFWIRLPHDGSMA
jgi:two-component system, sensor histidine kinase and response regulator